MSTVSGCDVTTVQLHNTGSTSVFSDSVLCFGKMSENPQSNYAWEDKLTLLKSSSQYRTLARIDGEPMEFEWIFQGFTTFAALQQSP